MAAATTFLSRVVLPCVLAPQEPLKPKGHSPNRMKPLAERGIVGA